MSRTLYLKVGPLHLPLRQRFIFVQLAMLAAILLCSLLALWQGTQQVSLSVLVEWLRSSTNHDAHEIDTLMRLRLPRVLVSLLAGALMAASAYLLQVVSTNKLADPGLLGISQGSNAAIILSAMFITTSTTLQALAGLVGGLLIGAFVTMLAARLRTANGLILAGLAVSITLGAFVEIMMVSGGVTQFSRYLSWSHGSLDAASFSDVKLLLCWTALLCPLLAAAPRLISPMMLGNTQAAVLGINPKKVQIIMILLATSLVAPVVAVAGPLSFIGLIATHLARRAASPQRGELLPIAMLCGGLLLLLADLAGRTLFPPLVIPAGLMASIGGVTGFLIISRMRRAQRQP